MVTKSIACPRCKNRTTVEGNTGEKIEVVCSSCQTKGFFIFPGVKPVSTIVRGSSVIDVENLTFTYPKTKKKAVDSVTFQVKEGEIFGFLGPNGAGKSTTQKVIMGLLKGFDGSVSILGKNLREWRTDLYERIGVCFESPNHYQKLTALENLELFSSFYRGKTIDPMTLLKMVDLERDADQRVGSFSKGMKTKLNFVRSLLNNPQVLFLDEPTTGLDPVSARQVKNIILEKRREGKSIFLTTHNMTDADELCDRVGFIVDGKVNLIENPKELKIRHGKKQVRVEYVNEEVLVSEEFSMAGLGDNAAFLDVLRGGQVQTIHTEEATLEDVFIIATGRKLK
ncbi:MAG: ABC transporter ATP-binding protein [Methanobacteriota archaeon]